MQKGNQKYELTFILGEKAGQEEGTAKVAQLKEFIEKHEGSIEKEEHWGRRELAYEIKRNRSGFYVTLWIDYPAHDLKPLDQELRFDVDIIRSLVTKAYTVAQPGSLYPVPEEEKDQRGPKDAAKEEKGSAEEMLRRTTSKPTKKAEAAEEPEAEAIPEEERLRQLDDSLEGLLKDDK